MAGYYALAGMQQMLPTVLAIASASLLYVAVADLIPSLHRRPEPVETAKQMLAIVGFQIEVSRMEASFKLSQNRDRESYENVITELYRRGDDNSAAVADGMAARREKLFGA